MLDSEFEFTQSETYGLTDIGMKRVVNQDQFLIAELSKSMLVSASSLAEIDTGRFFGSIQGASPTCGRRNGGPCGRRESQ